MWAAPERVWLRQVTSTCLLLLVCGALLVWGDPRRPGLVVAAAAVVAGVQLVSFAPWWAGAAEGWRHVLPVMHVAAVGLLLAGGELLPGAGGVLVLPALVSLALRPGPGGVVAGLASTALALLLPVLDSTRPLAWLPAVVAFVVVAHAAWVVHAIVEAERRQAAELARARDALDARAAELRASRDVLRNVVEAATQQAILAVDREGTVLTANAGAERVLDRPAGELVGTDVVALVDPEALAERVDGSGGGPLAPLAGAAVHGGAHVAEWPVVLPDGTRRPVEVVVTPRGALAALPDGYLLVATDVTARHDEQRLQDDFVGLVSHELRTPLTSILGYLELLRLDEASLRDDQRGYLEVVERNATRLQRLVDDLLTSAQLARGIPLVPDEVDVVQVVRAVVRGQLPAARTAGVELVVAGDAAVPLRSDATRLGQVVDNLVGNAVKYSHAGGTVEVTVERHPGPDATRVARIRVVDHGPGIAADELARLTERFYRTRDTRRRRVRGVGLGLSLVEAIVTDHDGSLSIDSEPGAGTTVEVVLPDLPPDD